MSETKAIGFYKESEKYPGFFTFPQNYRYLVNEHGVVISEATGKSLKVWIGNSGYKQVFLFKGGSATKTRYSNTSVHRIVATAFYGLPDEPEKVTVNHINCDKLNNHYTNLEWSTQAENNKHAVQTGLVDFTKAVEIRDWRSGEIFKFSSIKEAALHIGVGSREIGFKAKIGPKKKFRNGYQYRFSTDKTSWHAIDDKPEVYEYVSGAPVKIAIRWLSYNNAIIEVCDSVKATSERVGTSTISICRYLDQSDQPVFRTDKGIFQLQRCIGIQPWREVGDLLDEIELTWKKQPIVVCNENWQFLEHYDNLTKCADAHDLTARIINRRIDRKGDKVYEGKRFLRKLDYLRRSGKPDWMLV